MIRVPAILKTAIVVAILFGTPSAHAAEGDKAAIHDAYTSRYTERAQDLIFKALNLIGIHYKRGGNVPETGFDCSGFVQYVYNNAGVNPLPRDARSMSRVGEQIDKQELQPGDLVFYNTLRRTFSHVGIYVGDNRFIHAPATGGEVRVEQMDKPYWQKRFNGARRLNQDG